MPNTRQIITDLRIGACLMEQYRLPGGRGREASERLRAGADELERLLDELHMLRAFAEIPAEVE